MDACMIAYTLKHDDDGRWSIRCMGSTLASGLQLDSAMEQAHEMALTKHMDSGRPTCVEVLKARADNHVSDEAQPDPGWCLTAA